MQAEIMLIAQFEAHRAALWPSGHKVYVQVTGTGRVLDGWDQVRQQWRTKTGKVQAVVLVILFVDGDSHVAIQEDYVGGYENAAVREAAQRAAKLAIA